jgi:hypothetical protein
LLYPSSALAKGGKRKHRAKAVSAEIYEGAIDPSIKDNLGPPPPQSLERAQLEAGVAGNVLVNSRELCPNGRGLQQSETSVVVSRNVVVAAFNDARGAPGACPSIHAGVGWAYSVDGGASFTDGGGLPFPISFNNGDPWVGKSPDGNTFYLSGLWMGYGGLAFYRGSFIDGVLVWRDPVILSFPPGSSFMDKESFVVDPTSGFIYLTYTDFHDGQKIKVLRSLDGGDSWFDPVIVYPGGSQGSFGDVDSLGNLFVTFQSGSTMKVARSGNYGDDWQTVASFPYTTVGITFFDRSSDFPQLAIDRSGGARDGWVYVVWHSRSPQNVLRPYISHTEDFGESWSTPIPVNSDDTTALHWWPSVSVDAAGNVNVVYMDRRLNPGTGLTDVFLSQSTDGGSTFTDTRITDVSSNFQGVRFDGGFCYTCDYIRAVSDGTKVYATWVDARNGDPDIYSAVIDTAAVAARNSFNEK